MSVVRSTTTGIPTGRPASGAATPRFAMVAMPLDILTAKGQFCASFNFGKTPLAGSDYTCNPDFNVAQVGVVTRSNSRQEPDVLG